MKTNLRSLAALLGLSASMLTAGCGGVGVIMFDAKNGGPPEGPAQTFATYDVDCSDSFEESGGQTAMGATAGTYGVACRFEGKSLEDTFNILGVFHAAPMASGNWKKYHDKVIAKAQGKGCPGVAVRKTPPTENQEGEAIGAFCVTKKPG